MWQFLMILVVLGTAIVAIKIALVVICLVCLVFKPKETVSLLFVLGVLALIRNMTIWWIVVGVFIVGFGMYFHRKDA